MYGIDPFHIHTDCSGHLLSLTLYINILFIIIFLRLAHAEILHMMRDWGDYMGQRNKSYKPTVQLNGYMCAVYI